MKINDLSLVSHTPNLIKETPLAFEVGANGRVMGKRERLLHATAVVGLAGLSHIPRGVVRRIVLTHEISGSAKAVEILGHQVTTHTHHITSTTHSCGADRHVGAVLVLNGDLAVGREQSSLGTARVQIHRQSVLRRRATVDIILQILRSGRAHQTFTEGTSSAVKRSAAAHINSNKICTLQ